MFVFVPSADVHVDDTGLDSENEVELIGLHITDFPASINITEDHAQDSLDVVSTLVAMHNLLSG